MVIEELKPRLIANMNDKRYKKHKQRHKELNGEKQGDRIILNSEDSIIFSSDISSLRKEHSQHTALLKECKKI